MTKTSSTTRSDQELAYAVLRHVADLTESGLPVPMNVRTGGLAYGHPVEVQVDVADLGDWLTALDVVHPVWETDVTGKWEHARWPDGEFDGYPFTLTSCRLVATEVTC